MNRIIKRCGFYLAELEKNVVKTNTKVTIFLKGSFLCLKIAAANSEKDAPI
jgi:hypothetical protein